MRTNHKTSIILHIALSLLSLVSASAADSAGVAKQGTTGVTLPAKEVQLAKVAWAPASGRQIGHPLAKRTFNAKAAHSPQRASGTRGSDDILARHVCTFSGPIGPTLPAGARLHSNSAAHAGLAEVKAAPNDLIFDLPPGAFMRRSAPPQ